MANGASSSRPSYTTKLDLHASCIMNWKCPNCGKRVEFSTEQLNETRGVVVCPQCLSSDKVPGYDLPKPQRKPHATTASSSVTASSSTTQQPHMSTPPPRKSRPTPPPHRTKISFADQPSSPQSQPSKPKKSSGKKKNTRKTSGSTISSLGCLWRSIVYTLILLILYIVFGLLLQGL